MSELGNTTNPIDKPVENAEKVDEVKGEGALIAKKEESEEQPVSSDKGKGKGKGKAVEAPEEEEDDDDDDNDDDDEDDEDSEDDEDDLEMDEVDPSDIIPYSSRRSARVAQIDYSSEEAMKKAGLTPSGAESEAAPAAAIPADDEEDEDFKGDDTMED